MSKIAVIMVGVSGSGKSTYVRSHFPDAIICSADLHMMEGEEYIFKPSKLGEAHRKSQDAFFEACRWGQPEVVSDNTNLVHEHRKFYLDTALRFGYTVEIVVLPADVEEAAARNIHGVNHATILNQAKKLDIAPGIYEIRKCSEVPALTT